MKLVVSTIEKIESFVSEEEYNKLSMLPEIMDIILSMECYDLERCCNCPWQILCGLRPKREEIVKALKSVWVVEQ